jgi:hypothetical protein
MYFDYDQNVTPFYNNFILKIITWAPLNILKFKVYEQIYINSTQIMSKRIS